MLREILIGNTIVPLLKRGLDAFAARHRSIASNIVNIDVPEYDRREVIFEEKLKQALADRRKYLSATRDNHLPVRKAPASVHHLVRVAENDQPGDKGEEDYNGINIDSEMAQLATNQIQYRLTALAAQRQFSKLRSLSRP